MNFFSQLVEAGMNDVTLRIMQKGDTLTINVLPGSATSKTKPLNFTGTPAELDAAFFESVVPSVKEVRGIESNVDETKEKLATEKEEKGKDDKKKADKKKPAPAKEKKPEKEAAPKADTPNLFAE